MDHWENWKRKSIHPTSILEIGFDDQLIGLALQYFKEKYRSLATSSVHIQSQMPECDCQ